MPRALAFHVSIDVKRIAAEIDKQIANLRQYTELDGQLLNTATTSRHGEQVALFPFLDRGTRAHVIDPGENGILANEEQDFIVRGPVNHPGTPAYDISSRTLSYFEGVFSRAVAGASTRSLIRRQGEALDFSLIRQTFIKSLLSAKRYAESITPDAWVSVKDSYLLRVNGRKTEE